MSNTWNDVCATPTSTSWNTNLYAIRSKAGYLLFVEYDLGQGFVLTNGQQLFVGTPSARSRISRGVGTNYLTIG